MDEIKHTAASLKATSLDDALGTGSGYLAVFGNVDGQRDLIVPGAFAKSVASLEANRKRRGQRYLVPILWQHNTSEPIGAITNMKEDAYGLLIEFELDMTNDLGKRAYSALKKGYVGGFSIGYRAIKDRMRSDGVRELLEIQLIEGSVCTFPANTSATVFTDSMKRDTTVEEELGAIVLAMTGAVDSHIKKDDMDKNRNDERFALNIERPQYFGAQEPPEGFESRAAFEKDLRASRRTDDPVLGLLEPGSKNYNREIEARRLAREKKQAEQKAALEAERAAQAEKTRLQLAPTFTPREFALAFDLDEPFIRGRFNAWVTSGLVTPIDADTLTLNGDDARRQARREWERFESRSQEIAFRLAQGEKR